MDNDKVLELLINTFKLDHFGLSEVMDLLENIVGYSSDTTLRIGTIHHLNKLIKRGLIIKHKKPRWSTYTVSGNGLNYVIQESLQKEDLV